MLAIKLNFAEEYDRIQKQEKKIEQQKKKQEQ